MLDEDIIGIMRWFVTVFIAVVIFVFIAFLAKLIIGGSLMELMACFHEVSYCGV